MSVLTVLFGQFFVTLYGWELIDFLFLSPFEGVTEVCDGDYQALYIFLYCVCRYVTC